jgi:hypothetical protein
MAATAADRDSSGTRPQSSQPFPHSATFRYSNKMPGLMAPGGPITRPTVRLSITISGDPSEVVDMAELRDAAYDLFLVDLPRTQPLSLPAVSGSAAAPRAGRGDATGDLHVQAHGLVDDDGLQRHESEQADQQRQSKLRPAKTD